MKLNKVHNIYFIGIGGIGMSALATYFVNNGKNVAGYDKVKSPIVSKLLNLDVPVCFDASVSVIPEAYLDNALTLVVYTPAVPDSHAQLSYFKNNGFVVVKRSELLGEITKNTYCFAVAGTHGKTTTSTILGHILKETGVNATSFLGGISENYNSNLILGGDEVSVVEADEFDRSFLKLAPDIACITSTDSDHLDIYGDHESLNKSFKSFAELVADTLIVRKGLPIEGMTYGIEEAADYTAKNIQVIDGSYIFDIETSKELLRSIKIDLPGRHNVLNTVAALAMANTYGISLEAIAKALLTFKGVQRRFSYKIKTSDLVLIDDYAHHPTEIHEVVNSIEELYPDKKNVGVFQPHLYSRTADFVDDFARELGRFDSVILLDIYPAREEPVEGVTSTWLLEKIKSDSKQLSTKEELFENITKSKAEIVVMIGAGDIGELVDDIKNRLISED